VGRDTGAISEARWEAFVAMDRHPSSHRIRSFSAKFTGLDPPVPVSSQIPFLPSLSTRFKHKHKHSPPLSRTPQFHPTTISRSPSSFHVAFPSPSTSPVEVCGLPSPLPPQHPPLHPRFLIVEFLLTAHSLPKPGEPPIL
jgi:hypothetical protein